MNNELRELERNLIDNGMTESLTERVHNNNVNKPYTTMTLTDIDSDFLADAFENSYFGRNYTRDELVALFDILNDLGFDELNVSWVEQILADSTVYDDEDEVKDAYGVDDIDDIPNIAGEVVTVVPVNDRFLVVVA